VIRTASALAALGVWELASRLGWLDPFLFPPPSRVGTVLVELVGTGQVWPHFRVTVWEAVAGLVVGTASGCALGLLSATVRPVAEVLEPVMALLNAVPRVVLAPLFVIWFGIGVASKVALSFLLVMVVMFFATYTGVREVDPRLVERVRTLGGGRRDVVREVYVPSVSAWVASGLKVAVGFAFTGAVVGEFVASSQGLGYLLSFAQSTYNASLTLALITLVVAVILLLFWAFGRLERWWLRWKPAGPEVVRRAPESARAARPAEQTP
jgi:NitT/TauT family transport system permease protein